MEHWWLKCVALEARVWLIEISRMEHVCKGRLMVGPYSPAIAVAAWVAALLCAVMNIPTMHL
jgi:hypothetical protein